MRHWGGLSHASFSQHTLKPGNIWCRRVLVSRQESNRKKVRSKLAAVTKIVIWCSAESQLLSRAHQPAYGEAPSPLVGVSLTKIRQTCQTIFSWLQLLELVSMHSRSRSGGPHMPAGYGYVYGSGYGYACLDCLIMLSRRSPHMLPSSSFTTAWKTWFFLKSVWRVLPNCPTAREYGCWQASSLHASILKHDFAPVQSVMRSHKEATWPSMLVMLCLGTAWLPHALGQAVSANFLRFLRLWRNSFALQHRQQDFDKLAAVSWFSCTPYGLRYSTSYMWLWLWLYTCHVTNHVSYWLWTSSCHHAGRGLSIVRESPSYSPDVLI